MIVLVNFHYYHIFSTIETFFVSSFKLDINRSKNFDAELKDGWKFDCFNNVLSFFTTTICNWCIKRCWYFSKRIWLHA